MKNNKKIKNSALFVVSSIALSSLPLLLTSCDQQKESDFSPNNHLNLGELKKELSSNIKFNWNSDNLNYLQGYDFKMQIIDTNNIIKKNKNFIKIKWYKNDNLIFENNNQLSLVVNEQGRYQCKLIYTNNDDDVQNNEILITSSILNFNVVNERNNLFNNLLLSSTSNFLSNEITSCNITLLNLPDDVPISQYSIKWYRNNELIPNENSETITIDKNGDYFVEIFNNSNNTMLFKTSILKIIKKINATNLQPYMINWPNAKLIFNSTSNEFSYLNNSITLTINNLPEQYWLNSERYSFVLIKNNTEINLFNIDNAKKIVNITLNYINASSSGIYTFKIYDSLYKTSYMYDHPITINIGNVVNLNVIDLNISNNGYVDVNKPVTVSLNLDSLNINENEFIELYDIVWKNNTDNDNKVFAIYNTVGDYSCTIKRKNNYEYTKTIQFSIKDFRIATPNCLITNAYTTLSSTNSNELAYNVYDIVISNFNDLKNNNYVLKDKNNIEITKSSFQINDKDYNSELINVYDSKNNLITTYNLGNLIFPYIKYLIINDNNIQINEDGFLTSNILNWRFKNKNYTNVFINNSKIKVIKSNRVDYPMNHHPSSSNPKDPYDKWNDPYVWTGVFEGWNNLQSVKINCPNLISIEPASFRMLKNLNTVVIESNQTVEIRDYAFKMCTSLRNLELPKSISMIETQAFIECDSLESIKLSKDLQSINNSAFLGCNNLKFVDASLCKNLTIGVAAFQSCSSLSEFKYYGTNASNNVPINERGLRNISEYAFRKCISLVKFYPSNIVTNVQSGTIYLSDNINLGNYIFQDDHWISNIQHYPANNSWVPIGIFSNTKINSFDFANIKRICKQSFSDNVSKTWNKLNINEGVEEIDSFAFSGSYSLDEVSLPSSLKRFGVNVFADCEQLRTININFDKLLLDKDAEENIDSDESINSYSDIFNSNRLPELININFGKNVNVWNESLTTEPTTGSNYLTLSQLFSGIANKSKYKIKCYSLELKKQLINIGFDTNNIVVLQ